MIHIIINDNMLFNLFIDIHTCAAINCVKCVIVCDISVCVVSDEETDEESELLGRDNISSHEHKPDITSHVSSM